MKMSNHFKMALAFVISIVTGVLLWAVLFISSATYDTRMSAIGIAQFSDNCRLWWGRYPQSLSALASREGSTEELDGWNHPLVYIPCDPTNHIGLVISWGSDGKPGGIGSARDIVVPFGVSKGAASR